MTKSSKGRVGRLHAEKQAAKPKASAFRQLTEAELEAICRPYIEKQAAEIREDLQTMVVPHLIELRRLLCGPFDQVSQAHQAADEVAALCSFFEDYFPKGDAGAIERADAHDDQGRPYPFSP